MKKRLFQNYILDGTLDYDIPDGDNDSNDNNDDDSYDNHNCDDQNDDKHDNNNNNDDDKKCILAELEITASQRSMNKILV